MTQLTLTGNYVIIEKLESIGCDWSSSVKRKTRLVSSCLTLFPVLGLCKLAICNASSTAAKVKQSRKINRNTFYCAGLTAMSVFIAFLQLI